MRHKVLVLTVKELLKSVYIYGSYRKIKTGLSLFLDHSVHKIAVCENRPIWLSKDDFIVLLLTTCSVGPVRIMLISVCRCLHLMVL